MKCRFFVLSDSLVNFVNDNLQSIQYKVTYCSMETPFNMIIAGMTACGKTHYLLSMLERDHMKHFLLCPTFEWNKTYNEWRYR